MTPKIFHRYRRHVKAIKPSQARLLSLDGARGRSAPMGGYKGFTLIELMITTAILAIVVTLSAPSFTALLDKRRLASATSDVLNLTSLGRSQAITLNRAVLVDVRSNANTWCIGITDKANCDCRAAEGANNACTLDLPPGAAASPSLIRPVVDSAKHPGVTLDIPTGTTIRFRASNGLLETPVPQSLTAISTSSNRSMQIRVSPIGRSNVCGVGEFFPGGVPQC